MPKQLPRKKLSKAIVLVTLISFLLSPVAPVLAEESAVILPAEEKPIVVVEEKKEVAPVISGETTGIESAKTISEKNTEKAEDITTSEAVDIVEENLEENLPKSDGILKKEKDNLVLKDSTPNDGDKVSLPVKGTGKIEMTSSENGTTKIDLPDDGKTSQAAVVNESTVVYANTAPGVDTVVTVPSDNNVETYHIIRSSESPKSYAYKVTIPQGGKLERVDDKNIMVMNAEDLPEMSVSAPSAKDANGQEVPLKLIIEENKVILYVDHNESFAYPVMADPSYRGIKMTSSEIKFCSKPWSWNKCYKAGVTLKNEAEKIAESVNKKFKWDLWKGGSDAVRHCYWSGVMTQEFGVNEAKGFGDRHEDTDAPEKPKKPNTKDKKKIKKWENEIKEWERHYKEWKDDKDMDLHNNRMGRDWASENNKSIGKEKLKNKCIEGVSNNKLKRLIL